MRVELAPPLEANAPCEENVLRPSDHPVQPVGRVSNALFEESVLPSDHPISMQIEMETSALSDEDIISPLES